MRIGGKVKCCSQGSLSYWPEHLIASHVTSPPMRIASSTEGFVWLQVISLAALSQRPGRRRVDHPWCKVWCKRRNAPENLIYTITIVQPLYKKSCKTPIQDTFKLRNALVFRKARMPLLWSTIDRLFNEDARIMLSLCTPYMHQSLVVGQLTTNTHTEVPIYHSPP